MAEDTSGSGSVPLVSVIIPARNEEGTIQRCLDSLMQQHGVPFEIIVVNDGSTDRTRFQVERYREVKLIEANALPAGWTGKNNACWTAAKVARGSWLLFTDADTYHRRASLRRAVREAIEAKAELLSYSPKQEVEGFWQRALMPLIFGELARVYPPSQVSDPRSSYAAANGQYLLISRDAYDAIGGHQAVANSILEDVDLARAVKASGRPVRFRYGREAVRTRMYRTFTSMWEGWTKNLALLFPHPVLLALQRTIEIALLILGPAIFFTRQTIRAELLGLVITLVFWTFFYIRIRKSHFSTFNLAIAPLALPIYVALLLRSQWRHMRRKVSWKGRIYQPTPPNRTAIKPVGAIEPPDRAWQLQLLEEETQSKRNIMGVTATRVAQRILLPKNPSETIEIKQDARISSAANPLRIEPASPQESRPEPVMRDNGSVPMGQTVYLTRKAEFAAAHVYHNPDFTPEENVRVFGKCNNPNGHGHNYTLELTVKGEIDPKSGFVIDLRQLKEILHQEVLDAFDHRHLNKEVPEFANQIPTTENIAVVIWQRLAPKLKIAKMHRVRVYETPDLFVDFYGEQ